VTKTFDGKEGIEFGFYQGLEEAHGIEEAWYGRDGMSEACKNSYVIYHISEHVPVNGNALA
jgi:hypothetical protein